MSINNMENIFNGKEPQSEEGLCAEEDACRNEHSSQLNKSKAKAKDSNDLTRRISDDHLQMNSVELEHVSLRVKRFGPAMENLFEAAFETNASAGSTEEGLHHSTEDCIMRLQAAGTLMHMARQRQKGDASMNEHSSQLKETKAQAEGSKDLRKRITFKMKGVELDSKSGQRLEPAIETSKESVIGKNPSAAPDKEGQCSKGDVSTHEDGAKPIVNFAKLKAATFRRICSFYKIRGINSRSKKQQLVNAVENYFALQPPLTEEEVISKLAEKSKRRQA